MNVKQFCFFITACLCFVIGCKSTPKKTAINKEKIKHQVLNRSIGKSNISKKDLIGIWTGGESENATFKIESDSIYYVDLFKNYKYDLNANVIKIYYEDGPYTAKVYFIKDTLVMNSPEYGIAKFWKFTN